MDRVVFDSSTWAKVESPRRFVAVVGIFRTDVGSVTVWEDVSASNLLTLRQADVDVTVEIDGAEDRARIIIESSYKFDGEVRIV